ncbi:hypothetical protein ID855_21195, partial [Xenorhabdus sp. ZM]|uniref:hypothetical protein n=1 Tax=Xenorhabdus szentirmaii TaxID=290112 RepID=UPI0019B7F8AF
PVYRTAGGRSAGAGGREPASGAPATLGIAEVSETTPCLHDNVFCSREAPSGGCTGRRWRARERATQQREVRAARSQ